MHDAHQALSRTLRHWRRRDSLKRTKILINGSSMGSTSCGSTRSHHTNTDRTSPTTQPSAHSCWSRISVQDRCILADASTFATDSQWREGLLLGRLTSNTGRDCNFCSWGDDYRGGKHVIYSSQMVEGGCIVGIIFIFFVITQRYPGGSQLW